MFNIANNHRIPLVKTAFYFSLYTRKMAATPFTQFTAALLVRSHILLIVHQLYAAPMHKPLVAPNRYH